MYLHLITCRDDASDFQDLFEVGDRTVGDSDGSDFTRRDELFHGFPRVDVGPRVGVEIAGAVGASREIRIVALGVEGDGPAARSESGGSARFPREGETALPNETRQTHCIR